MSSPSEQPPELVVRDCQDEVRKIFETLRTLGETSGMENWSYEIRHSYRMALDDLAALQAFLHLYPTLLQKDEEDSGNGRMPEDSDFVL